VCVVNPEEHGRHVFISHFEDKSSIISLLGPFVFGNKLYS